MRKPHLILTTLSLCAASASFIVPALAQDTTTTQNTNERPIVYPSASIANFHPLPLNEVLLSADVVTSEEIERSSASSVSELIAQKTGIEFSRTGGPGSVTSHFLRGQKSENFILQVDGIRVHTDSFGNVIMPELSISQVSRIELLKGNASALYGEAAIGGVINIITKNRDFYEDGFLAVKYGTYDTSEVSTGVSKYINGVNLSFTGTKFRTTGFDSQPSTNTNVDKDGYEQDSYNFNLSKRLSQAANIMIGLRNRQSKMDYDDSNPTSNFATREHIAETENQEQFLAYELKKDRLIDLSFDYSVSKRDRNDYIDGGPASALVPWKNDVIQGNTKTLKIFNTSSFGENHKKSFITQGFEHIESEFNSSGSSIYGLSSHRDTNAFFVGYRGVNGSHSFQTNLRHDKITLGSDKIVETQIDETNYLLGYGYDFGKYYKIAFSNSTGFRAPDAYAYGEDPDVIKKETFVSNEISIQRDKNSQLLRLTAFSTKTNDEIEYIEVSPFIYKPRNIGKTENSGLEINFSGTSGKIDFDLDITFQDPKKSETSEAAKQLKKRAKTYGKINLSRRFGDYRAGGSLNYSARKPDTSNKNIASFTRLDGYIARQLTDSLNVILKAENITNTEYETTAGYRTPERSLFLTLKYDFVNEM